MLQRAVELRTPPPHQRILLVDIVVAVGVVIVVVAVGIFVFVVVIVVDIFVFAVVIVFFCCCWNCNCRCCRYFCFCSFCCKYCCFELVQSKVRQWSWGPLSGCWCSLLGFLCCCCSRYFCCCICFCKYCCCYYFRFTLGLCNWRWGSEGWGPLDSWVHRVVFVVVISICFCCCSCCCKYCCCYCSEILHLVCLVEGEKAEDPWMLRFIRVVCLVVVDVVVMLLLFWDFTLGLCSRRWGREGWGPLGAWPDQTGLDPSAPVVQCWTKSY